MAYIGREPQIGNYQICDAISVVNGQAAYTMQVGSVNVIPESVNHMIVSLNGVIQKPGSSYTISSSTITFSSNLATGDSIDFIYLLGNVLDLGTPSDSTVTTAKLATTLFTGATDIGAAIADADLFLMDDGAGGTIRKTTASRLKTYIGTFDTDAAQVFNESSNDVDFRVESNGNANMLFVDGGENAVGIGTGTPDAQLHIVGSDTTNQVIIENTDGGVSSAPDLVLFRNSASPVDGDVLGRIDFRGDNDAGQEVNYIFMSATATDVSDGSEDVKLEFEGMKAGNNAKLFTISEAEVIVNDDSGDVDFRVESDAQTHMLFVNAGNSRIGLQDSSPAYMLESGNSDTGKGWSLANENNVYKIRTRSDASDTQTHIQFENTNGVVGSIKTNSTATQFNTSSDYRLKENVDYDWDATTRLKQLKPARFNWIADDTNTLLDGFIAHEVSSIVPEAISGNKDATETLTNVVKNADGSLYKCNFTEAEWEKGKIDGIFAANSTWAATYSRPDYQSIDQSKLVPLLVKTIQELEVRIKTLEDA